MMLPYGEFLGRTSKQFNTAGFAFSEVIDVDIADVPRHTHADDHFVMVIRGEYITEASKGNPVVGPTTLIFNPAGLTHRDRFRTRGGRFLTISVDPEFGRQLKATHHLRDHASVFDDARENWIAARLYREFAPQDLLSGVVLESLALELFGMLAEVSTSRNGAPGWLRQACDLIEDRSNEPVRVAEIAKAVAVHPFHLTRTFRRFLNCTTGEYLRGCRLSRVAGLLRNTRTPLSAIAYQTGFPDQSHMTHSFRRQTGYTPAAYRSAFGMLD